MSVEFTRKLLFPRLDISEQLLEFLGSKICKFQHVYVEWSHSLSETVETEFRNHGKKAIREFEVCALTRVSHLFRAHEGLHVYVVTGLQKFSANSESSW